MSNRPQVCVGALVFNNNELFLGLSPKWNEVYIIPSGRVEYGESLEQAAQREVREEIGLETSNFRHIT